MGVPVPFVAPRVWARWGWDRAGHVASHLRDLRVIRRAARFVLDFPRVNNAMVPVGVGEVRFGDRSRCERDADGEGRSKPSITGTIVIDATWRYAPRHLHWHRRLDSRASRRLGGVEVAGGCARHEAPLLFWQSGPPKEKAGSVFGCHEGAYLSTLERRTRGVRCRCERVSTGSDAPVATLHGGACVLMTEVARLEPLMCELIGSARLRNRSRTDETQTNSRVPKRERRLTARGASTHTRPARTPRTE